MENQLIDTHAHIYLPQFEEDRAEVLERAKEANLSQILMPNIDLESVPQMYALEDSSNGFCKSMMGLHPCSVDENYKEVLAKLKAEFDKRTFIAVGEIGLDLYWKQDNLESQKAALRTQLNWSIDLNLPVSIHCRDAGDELIELLQEFKPHSIRGAWHCFSSSIAHGKKAIDLGLHLGIGGVCTYKKAAMKDILPELDSSRFILETDAPYLAPVPKRGKRNESAYLAFIAAHLAEMLQMSTDELAKITTATAKELFKLD